MRLSKNVPGLLITLIILLFISAPASPAQKKGKDKKSRVPAGRPVIWKNPGNIRARDLFLGPGGEEMRPDTSSITFIKAETGGYSPKFRVRDGRGRVWLAKLGKEAQSETAAVRLLWAVGYMTEINYLVPCAHIQGAPRPRKKVERCEGQGFRNVRFERIVRDPRSMYAVATELMQPRQRPY